MGFASEVLELLLDSKHIANKPPGPGAGNWEIWRAYMRLKRLRLSNGGGDVRLLGFQVRYLDPVNLARLFREIFVNRLYDVPLGLDAPMIVDCGSNIGMSILFFKNLYPRATVIGFEPNPLTYPVLRHNVEQNQLLDVTLHQKAVADQRGRMELYVNPGEPGALNSGMYRTRRVSAAVSVQVDMLSGYIDGDVDLLKLDIEGAEELVIRELAEQGKLSRVRNIVCEYHHHHHRDSDADRLSLILSILEQAGFGYQLDAYYGRSRAQRIYQDVLVYAYRKDPEPWSLTDSR